VNGLLSEQDGTAHANEDEQRHHGQQRGEDDERDDRADDIQHALDRVIRVMR
jgi:hypothetical protein